MSYVPNPYRQLPYRIGLYEKSMPNELTLEQKLAATRAAGFSHMEISIDETEAKQARLEWTAAERAEVRHAIERTGTPILTMCLSGHRKWPLGSHDEATRERGCLIFQKAIELASDLGIRIIQLAGYDVYYEDSDLDTLSWFSENLRRGIDYAAAKGVMCGFETMETPFMDTIGKAMAYVNEVNSPYLGVYPDLGNLTNACELYGLSVDDEIASGAGHLVAMHLKETVPGTYRDMRYGEGRVDFARGAEAACNAGVRLFVGEFWHDGREDWQEGLAEANDFLHDALFDAFAD